MTYSAEVLADSPVVYYRLGEPSGTSMADSSGNSRTGTYVNTPTLGVTGALTGDANTAITTVRASNQHGTFPTTGLPTGASAYTLECWFKVATFDNQQGLVNLGTSGINGRSNALRLGISAGTPQLVNYWWANDYTVSVPGLSVNAWHHAAATWDGTTHRMYVDGAQVGTPRTPTAPNVLLGTPSVARTEGSPTNYLGGSIDEVAVYATALSAARILAHYTAGTTSTVTVNGGLATETDSALPSNVAVVGGLATETDTALAGSVVIPDAKTIFTIGNDRRRDSIGYATWEPPVVEPPALPLVTHDYVTAHAYTALDTTSRPTLTGLASASAPRLRPRIVVAGRDITFWRDVPTPEPKFSLVSPLLYGSGQLELPQVHAAFETPGVGDLDFLRPFAPVKVQLVDPDTGDVEHTIYRGFLLDPQIDGRNLVFGLMGQATGPAALSERPARIFRRWNDIGHWWWGMLRDVKVRQVRNASTGIKMQNRGGMFLLDYAQQLSADGVTRVGNQWTAMPDSDGVYHVARKDRTTVHATVYFDDAHAVPSLRRDPAEEPNTVYATAVSKQGRRIRFADYPALQLTEQPDFPNTGGTPMEPGDTDGDTDSGGGVTALISRLWQVGYLSFDDRPGGWDDDVTRAVKDLQDDANLTQSGEVNPATWDALFDFAVTGYNLAGAQIRPAAQKLSLRRYKRTPSGAILGPNPSYDPHAIPVSRTVDVGVGFTQNQTREFARTLIAEGATPNWTGTVTLASGEFAGGIGVLLGEHTPGDAFDADDVVDPRLLQPGMNLWAPLFDGGTLFHIGGVEANGPDGVSLSVDTRARDTMEVWEVIARNRESRRNPARAWLREFRSSYMDKDAVSEFDDLGGTIVDTELNGGAWNVIPVVAGQEGTVARIRLRLANDECEYVVAVFGRKIGKGILAGTIGNPLTEAGSERWTDTDVQDGLRDSHVLLYVAGDESAPCGYSPKAKTDEDTPGITGRWDDDAAFGYRCFDDYSLWLAIYPAEDCTLQGGRVMWNQLEAGS